jgi:cell fate regulator YaaT (PSP1 superfamily)
VDFRELVKELARTFKTRIELRQISSREETKRLGCGIGACGLSLCCTTFLPDFSHVTLDHARKQQLSNNVAKLSGYCGRLKCCLLFEYENYVSAFEKYPPLNSTIDTKEGTFKMMKVDVFKDIIYLYNRDQGKYKSITYQELAEYTEQGRVFMPENEEEENDELSDEDLKYLEDD